MGFLKVFGKALRFEESKEFHKIVKDNAVDLIIYSIHKEKSCSPQFGYEFEFHKINIDEDKKMVQIDLSGQEDIIRSSTYSLFPKGNFNLSHEYGGWMIEVMHENPFQYNRATDVIDSVKNMYEYINDRIGVNKMLSFPSFPFLGVGDNYYKKESANNSIEEDPNAIPNGEETSIEIAKTNTSPHAGSSITEEDLSTNPYSKSIFIHDDIICKHPRFGCLTRNIRERRGKKVEIKVPIYKDINTIMEPSEKEPFPGFVYMDAMAFGMGNCCVQVTLGACCICTATYLYDQLLPICPILLALSSTSPVYKGKLTDFDNRFNLICEGVDDRTDEEKNPNSSKFICKSRYSPVYSYISEQKYSLDFNNDAPKFPFNKEYYERFINSGINPKLSEHFANILVRDPLVIFDEKIHIEDKSDMTHFECLNSTNWNSLRFKLPRISDNDTCFKIEVRPCDLQMTPFENTAMISLILCLFGSIMYYDMNFVMPITKVDENFRRAYKRDAIIKEKFFWRVNSISKDLKTIDQDTHFLPITNEEKGKLTYEEDQENIKELTIDEIIHGCPKYNYPGLKVVLDKCMKEFYKTDRFNEYIELFSKRARGELWTGAKYVREFVLNHPQYKKDSVLSEEMNYDLVNQILKIQNGELKPKEMFGNAI